MEAKSLTIDDSNSEVSFKVKKLGIFTIKGSITHFSGDISFSEDNVKESRFNICVSPSTIDTGNTKRDEHLKSKDFFSVNEHPKICFQSTSIQSATGGYKAIGKLTMLETTQEVEIPFSFSDGLFTGQFAINRLDFHLGEKFPAFIVGQTIQIRINCKIN